METRELILAEMKATAPGNLEKAREIAEKFGVKEKAVIAMYARNEVEYKRKERVGKTGEPVVTKDALVAEIEAKLGFEAGELAGLEKANKAALEKLIG